MTDTGRRITAPMRTVDRITIRAPLARIFQAAADVEQWPRILPHSRAVRFL